MKGTLWMSFGKVNVSPPTTQGGSGIFLDFILSTFLDFAYIAARVMYVGICWRDVDLRILAEISKSPMVTCMLNFAAGTWQGDARPLR